MQPPRAPPESSFSTGAVGGAVGAAGGEAEGVGGAGDGVSGPRTHLGDISREERGFQIWLKSVKTKGRVPG